MSMDSARFEFGDQVRHARRPEWGVGGVLKVENLMTNGQADQRLTIRFPAIGLKVLLASVAELQRVGANGVAQPSGLVDDHTLTAHESSSEMGWLGSLAKRKPEDVMTGLPPQASDPFAPLRRRLEFTCALYRFDASPSKLIEWAVAQSGLNDPLSRFNRHELEQFFKRYAYERDLHLVRLGQECMRQEPDMFRQVIAKAPSAAQQTLRKADVLR
jgi:hypothetical protein